MKISCKSLFTGAVFSLLWIGIQPLPALAETVISAQEAGQVVAIPNVAIKDRTISGDLVNHSSHAVRDVQLLVRAVWYWDNEFHPGENPPGLADYVTLREEIPAGGTARFTYSLPSESVSRSDGHFETEVSVAGFTQIVPQNEQPRYKAPEPVS